MYVQSIADHSMRLLIHSPRLQVWNRYVPNIAKEKTHSNDIIMLPFFLKKEFLAITAGFGVVVSSGITLVVRLLVITGTRARSY